MEGATSKGEAFQPQRSDLSEAAEKGVAYQSCLGPAKFGGQKKPGISEQQQVLVAAGSEAEGSGYLQKPQTYLPYPLPRQEQGLRHLQKGPAHSGKGS